MTAGERERESSYIWLQSGWYKNRPLFDFSLAPCALPALCNSILGSVPHFLSLPVGSLLLLLHVSLFNLLSHHVHLSHILFQFPLLRLSQAFLSGVYIHYRLKQLGNISLARLHSSALLSPTTQTFTLTTPSCIPVIIPTR